MSKHPQPPGSLFEALEGQLSTSTMLTVHLGVGSLVLGRRGLTWHKATQGTVDRQRPVVSLRFNRVARRRERLG